MPLLTITTNISLDDPAAQRLCNEASAHIAGLLAKPESYVMISVQANSVMSFGGENTPCAMLELSSLGLPVQQTSKFSESLCEFIEAQTDISPARIYIRFSDPDRRMWGWDKRTF